jgi:hypothetical protein
MNVRGHRVIYTQHVKTPCKVILVNAIMDISEMVLVTAQVKYQILKFVCDEMKR